MILKELADKYNRVVIKDIPRKEFQDYVIQNKELLKFPNAVTLLMESVEITEEYLKNNKDFCMTILELINSINIDDVILRTLIRVELFKEYMENIKEEV